jgi:hypothetical protein
MNDHQNKFMDADLSDLRYHLNTKVYNYHQYQGKTNDCAPTTLAIAANAYLGKPHFQGSAVGKSMNKPHFQLFPCPKLVVHRIPNWATFPWGIVNYLKRQQIDARWRLFGTNTKLIENINNDQITIIILGGLFENKRFHFSPWAHAKILYGFDPQRGYLFVDPAYDRNLSDRSSLAYHGLFWQDGTSFNREWRNLMRIYIEIG